MQVGAIKSGVVSDPNIVPLIDVLLVLIIIFMVITPSISDGLPVAIPRPAPQAAPTNSDAVVVRVLPDGNLMINFDRVDWHSLAPRMSQIFAQRPEKVAFVAGAADVSFAEVARAVGILRTAGVDRIGLITDLSH